MIDYDHKGNLHTLEGPRCALSILLESLPTRSLLDVGCGRGTWLEAAQRCGVQDVLGVDGVSIPAEELFFSPESFYVRDLTLPLDFGRRFDLAICLEVGEHLEEKFAEQLVANLASHSDTVLFSGACPGQPGQHHVNCQWPVYWQRLFNKLGYVCSDWPRRAIWDDARIEVWYRQNMFVAQKNPLEAGKEPRIPSAVHSDLLPTLQSAGIKRERMRLMERIANGEMPVSWLISVPVRGLVRKLVRKLRLGGQK